MRGRKLVDVGCGTGTRRALARRGARRAAGRGHRLLAGDGRGRDARVERARVVGARALRAGRRRRGARPARRRARSTTPSCSAASRSRARDQAALRARDGQRRAPGPQGRPRARPRADPPLAAAAPRPAISASRSGLRARTAPGSRLVHADRMGFVPVRLVFSVRDLPRSIVAPRLRRRRARCSTRRPGSRRCPTTSFCSSRARLTPARVTPGRCSSLRGGRRGGAPQLGRGRGQLRRLPGAALRGRAAASRPTRPTRSRSGRAASRAPSPTAGSCGDVRRELVPLGAAALVGGLAGSLLLLRTSEPYVRDAHPVAAALRDGALLLRRRDRRRGSDAAERRRRCRLAVVRAARSSASTAATSAAGWAS